MTTENVIDFDLYRDNQLDACTSQQSISSELETAIQDLIYQLRELGPCKSGTDE